MTYLKIHPIVPIDMIKISKRFEYALLSIGYLHENTQENTMLGVRAVALELQIPFDTLSKVFQILVHAKILKPVHGAHGGHILERPLKEIKFIELYRLFEEIPFGHKCNGPRDHCEIYSHCKIVTPMLQLHERLFEFFSELNVYDFLYPQKN